MRAPAISIIIPIYNTGRILSRCIASCLGQSFRDTEVILVNDASTDNSLGICEEYAKQDERVVVINKTENEGVDKARFSGLARARGEYVMFVDSDDELANPDVVSFMHKKAEEMGVDYVETGSRRVLGKWGWIKRASISCVLGLVEQPELFDKYYVSFFGCNILSTTMWGKLYRKSVIDSAGLSPTGLKHGEDTAFNMQLFPHLHNVYISDSIGYNYRMDRLIQKYNPNILPAFKALHLLKEECIERFQYHKATDLVHIELKNILKSDLCQAIAYGIGTRDEIEERVQRELEDPVYERMMNVTSYPDFHNEPFVKAVVARDANAIYGICQQIVRKERPKRMLKQIALRMDSLSNLVNVKC